LKAKDMVQRAPTIQWIRGAIIGSLYFALTIVFQAFSFGQVQIRVSEILTVLPFFFPEAIWGLTIGCLLANLFSPFGLIDIVFGTLCTFIAAFLTYLFRWIPNKRLGAYMGILPPILINGFGVGFYVSCLSTSGICSLQHFSFPVYIAIAGSIMLGELVAAGLGGSILITYLLTKGKHLYSLPKTTTQGG
jgi:uncharacterized membrane protein